MQIRKISAKEKAKMISDTANNLMRENKKMTKSVAMKKATIQYNKDLKAIKKMTETQVWGTVKKKLKKMSKK